MMINANYCLENAACLELGVHLQIRKNGIVKPLNPKKRQGLHGVLQALEHLCTQSNAALVGDVKRLNKWYGNFKMYSS